MDREKYLRTVLQLDPIGRAGAVVAARNALRGYPIEPEPDPVTADRIGEWLNSWRHGFWEAGEAASCRARLLETELSRYPGLSDRVAHLDAVWRDRPAFLALMEDPALDREFLAFVGQVLVAPSDQACGLTTVYLAPGKEDRPRVLATAAALAERVPDLYALRRDWLDDLVANPTGVRRTRVPRQLLVKGIGLLTILVLSVWLILEMLA